MPFEASAQAGPALVMKVRVLYHDHCFDGAASAAFFSRFTRERFYNGAEYAYTGMAHKASQLFDEADFDGDENAIVDFKYSSSDRLTWWFDHHQSAFLSPEDQQDYERKKNSRRFYFDPEYRSCTEWIAHVARTVYGYEAPDLAELVRWAGIVDSANYESAEAAVAMRRAGRHEADAGHRGDQGLRRRSSTSSGSCRRNRWPTS